MSDMDDLYAGSLDEFVARRSVLAKALKADGRGDEAAAVAALRKPSVAAWAVNQVVRGEGKRFAALLAAGDALRDAQEDLLAGRGDGRALRAANERVRDAVDALLATVDDVSPGVLERVGETLHAAALDADAREAVRSGHLERELRHAGLGIGLGESLAPAPAPAARPSAGGRSAGVAARKGGGAGKATASGAGRSAGVAAPKGGGAGKATASGAGRSAAADRERAAAERTAERERLAAEREAVRAAEAERAAARKAAKSAELAARREAEVAARALRVAQERRDRAAEAFEEAEAALSAARDRAAATTSAHDQAQAELEGL